MAASTENFSGRTALIVGHAAGMLDLVAAPLWIGVLIQYRHLSPVEAGILIATYTAGVFLTFRASSINPACALSGDGSHSCSNPPECLPTSRGKLRPRSWQWC